MSCHVARTTYIKVQQPWIYSSEVVIYNSVISNCFTQFGNASNQMTQTTVLGSDEYFNIIIIVLYPAESPGARCLRRPLELLLAFWVSFLRGSRNELKRAIPVLPSKNISAEFIEPTPLCLYKNAMEYLIPANGGSGGD